MNVTAVSENMIKMDSTNAGKLSKADGEIQWRFQTY